MTVLMGKMLVSGAMQVKVNTCMFSESYACARLHKWNHVHNQLSIFIMLTMRFYHFSVSSSLNFAYCNELILQHVRLEVCAL